MSKHRAARPATSRARAALAAIAGVAILSGGLSSFALWSDSSPLADARIFSGALGLDAAPNATWADTSPDAVDSTWDPQQDRLTPGDIVTMTQDVTLTATGKNIGGEVTITGVDTSQFAGYLTTRFDIGGPLQRKSTNPDSPDYNVFFFNDPIGTRTLTAQITFTFDPNTPSEMAQGAAVDLSGARFALTMVRAAASSDPPAPTP